MDEFVIKAYLALSCLIVHLWLPFFAFSGMIFFFFGILQISFPKYTNKTLVLSISELYCSSSFTDAISASQAFCGSEIEITVSRIWKNWRISIETKPRAITIGLYQLPRFLNKDLFVKKTQYISTTVPRTWSFVRLFHNPREWHPLELRCTQVCHSMRVIPQLTYHQRPLSTLYELRNLPCAK